MLNKCQIIGNLGADPETRTTGGGAQVCNLRVAVNERVKKGDTWADQTEWFRVVCFGKTAENCAKYLRKGRQVYVEGRLKTNTWKDKEGVERKTTEIVAFDVKFLGGKHEDGPRDAQDPGAGGAVGGDYDDEVPF
jgi:single-strand DNA-binding protein